jgi:hexosaminidase
MYRLSLRPCTDARREREDDEVIVRMSFIPVTKVPRSAQTRIGKPAESGIARTGGSPNHRTARSAEANKSACSQPFRVIPQPVRLTAGMGSFRVDPEILISARPDAAPEAELLAERLSTSLGCRFAVGDYGAERVERRIELRLDSNLAGLGAEGYRLSVNPDAILLSASDRPGLFYGLQTLLQLFPPTIFETNGRRDGWSIPCVEIEDMPRFGWRGAMLDVARHFMSVDFVKKFIDLLALHKLNILHLHLNDDQGWRIEINKYPKLTSVGATRSKTVVGAVYQNPIDPDFDASVEQFDNVPHGGYYTQDEARELVAYAAARHVTIVPEIDMPGHAMAAIVAYPELGNVDVEHGALEVSPRWGIHGRIFNVRESTFAFLYNVLAEVMDIFPAPFIHIGGDEAHKQEWKDSPEAQTRMKELGLSTVEELQSYFIGRMNEFVTQFGRRIIGWDEILEGGLAANAVVMSWRGEKGGIAAAMAGHDVIMTPNSHTYFDYYQSQDKSREPQAFPQGIAPLSTVYCYEPIPDDLPEEHRHHVLGSQGQLWSEYMPHPAQVEYMAFPRLCALAEVMWSPREIRDYEGFVERLRRHCERLDLLDVNYRPLDKFAS